MRRTTMVATTTSSDPFFQKKIYHLQFPARKKLVKKNPPSTSVTTTPWSNCSWLNNDRREKCLWDSLHPAKSRPHSWLSDCPLTAAPPLPVDGKHTSVPWHFTFSDSFIKIRLNLFQAAARTMSNTDDLSSHWRCFQPDRSFFLNRRRPTAAMETFLILPWTASPAHPQLELSSALPPHP